MSDDTFEQLLNRLEHLDREKGEDLAKLKKIILAASTDELKSFLNELDLKKVANVFNKLLRSDEKFIYEDIGDIFVQIQDSLGIEDYYERFTNLIKDALTGDLHKLKSIHLRLLLNCCKDTRIQSSLVNDGTFELVINCLGDKDGEVAKRSAEILKYLCVKVDLFLENHLFNDVNHNHLQQIKNKNEINKFRYYELLIALIIDKETFLLNTTVQQGLKELLDLTFLSTDDPLVVRNCLIVIDKLIENNKGVEYLNQCDYFKFIGTKITNPQSDMFINLLMPGYIETFSKLGSTSPDFIVNYQNVIDQIVEFILTDNYTSCSIEAIGLVGRQGRGKMILNSNQKFVHQCMPRLGRILDSSSELKLEVLHCLSSLFDLNDLDATVEVSDLLNIWYTRLMNDRKKTTQTIYLLCKQVFPEIHLNSLNLIRILCKHCWGQTEFAQLNTFMDFVLNRGTEVDYKGKEAKFKLITELATSPFTSKAFGGVNHAKIRKVYKEGAFYVEQDVSVAVL